MRDGLPLLVADGSDTVIGQLLKFTPYRAAEAWSSVRVFEPKDQYRWELVEVSTSEGHRRANVLVARSPDQGSTDERLRTWGANLDPVLTEGMEFVRREVVRICPDGTFPTLPPDGRFWRLFFGIQAVYLLLWTVVERCIVLTVGGVAKDESITAVGKAFFGLPEVEMAIASLPTDLGARRPVNDSRRPTKKKKFETPDQAFDYWYLVRSNLTHRGKSAFMDGELLYRATLELHDVLSVFLAQIPEIADHWNRKSAERGDESWCFRLRPAGTA
jgi:hypothetical protein